MGIFSRIKTGISSKANAALDKAIDPEKEIDMAILDLEEGRKEAIPFYQCPLYPRGWEYSGGGLNEADRKSVV